jgi:hypothetical protein
LWRHALKLFVRAALGNVAWLHYETGRALLRRGGQHARIGRVAHMAGIEAFLQAIAVDEKPLTERLKPRNA